MLTGCASDYLAKTASVDATPASPPSILKSFPEQLPEQPEKITTVAAAATVKVPIQPPVIPRPLLDKLASENAEGGSDKQIGTSTEAKQNSEGQPTVTTAPPKKQLPSINITPFTQYADSWGESSNAQGGDFSDSYTRLIITSELPADGKSTKESQGELTNEDVGDSAYKSRGSLARYFLGKEFAINFSARVMVGQLEETIPLVSIGHESNSGGEKWSRTVYHSSRDHPLFLVKANGSNASPKITVTMQGSQSYASHGATSALKVVLGVANAVSPTSSIATTLTAQSSKDRANALDNAISKLFSMDIKEEHTTTPEFRFWNASNNQPNGIDVRLYIPTAESWKGSNPVGENIESGQAPAEGSSDKKLVGKWTISFDYPRPSAFSDWRICAALPESGTGSPPIFQSRCAGDKKTAEGKVIEEIDASEVLNYDLVRDGQKLVTIRTYLVQQEWFSQAQSKVVATNTKLKSLQPKHKDIVTEKAKLEQAAKQMCRNIRNTITGLNLNGFDANIVVWAVLEGMPWPDESPNEEMKSIKGCDSTAKLKNGTKQ